MNYGEGHTCTVMRYTCVAYDAMSVVLRTGTSMYSIPMGQGVDEPCTDIGNCTDGTFGAAVKDARRDSRMRLARRDDLHRRRWRYELTSAGYKTCAARVM